MSDAPELRDARDLPELLEGELDATGLASLERDLASLARVDSVLPRPSARTLVPPAPVTLADGFARLRAGDLRGLQVRYVYAGEAWVDTLLALPHGGVRVVRMRQPAG